MSTSSQNEFLLLFRGTDWSQGLSPEEIQNVMNEWKGWFDGLVSRGIAKAGQPLEPEGKIVSGKKGRVVADGPFAESKEAIGGYFLLKAGSLDEAVAIAKNCPSLNYGGIVEVRPIAEICPAAEAANRALAEKQAEAVGA